MGTIIAVNTKVQSGELLPMKQSPELEAKKSSNQQNEELCNFIKNAFCVDGQVSMVYGKMANPPEVYFVLNDSERGEFQVTIG